MRIALLGGGGHCRSCLDVVRSAGHDIAGIVAPQAVATIFGYPRLGDDSWLDSESARDVTFLVTVGQVSVSPLRRELYAKLRTRGLSPATVTSTTAILSADARVADGSILMHRTIVNAGARIGANCIINTGAIIEHDAVVADHCHISTGATVNGGASVGSGCMIGSGAIVLQGIEIASNVTVGAGAVVRRNIEEAGIWVGVPARRVA